MKFSDIEAEKWESLKPYLDTAIVPITALTGYETPPESTQALEQLRDWLDIVEQTFNGRIVTYPAFHFYNTSSSDFALLTHTISNLKEQGFKYVVAVTRLPLRERLNLYPFDAIIAPEFDDQQPSEVNASDIILKMWTMNQ